MVEIIFKELSYAIIGTAMEVHRTLAQAINCLGATGYQLAILLIFSGPKL